MSIRDIITGTHSQTAITILNNFQNQGGTVDLNATSTNFIANMNMQLGINQGGTISISPADVSQTAKLYKMTTNMAQMEIAVHELGHDNYAAKDALAFTSTVSGREAWCYSREAEASYFGFTIALEAQANGVQLGVLGPQGQPNLYTSMLSFSQTLTGNPQSLPYQNAMISFAKNAWQNDPQYQAFCKAWAAGSDTKAPRYIAPEDDRSVDDSGGGGSGGGSGGGGGGGSGGGGGPTGGGYWNPPPFDDDPVYTNPGLIGGKIIDAHVMAHDNSSHLPISLIAQQPHMLSEIYF